jgi:hypothetical protein
VHPQVGLYVFQASLGEHCQCIVYTVRRRNGVLEMQLARTGTLQVSP